MTTREWWAIRESRRKPLLLLPLQYGRSTWLNDTGCCYGCGYGRCRCTSDACLGYCTAPSITIVLWPVLWSCNPCPLLLLPVNLCVKTLKPLPLSLAVVACLFLCLSYSEYSSSTCLSLLPVTPTTLLSLIPLVTTVFDGMCVLSESNVLYDACLTIILCISLSSPSFLKFKCYSSSPPNALLS